MSKAINDYNSINWEQLFYYDDSAFPTCLRWKEDRLAGRWMKIVAAQRGDIAGNVHIHPKTQYKSCSVPHSGKNWKAARVIWIMHNGFLDKNLVIDHIDGDTLNNKLSNLRAVPQELNNRNASLRKDNSSGKGGVYFTTASNYKYTFATASWYESSNKRKCKHFSVGKLGLLPAFAMACKYREEKIKELNAKGYDYSEDHGK